MCISLLLWEKGDHEVVDEELDTHKKHLIRHASRATFPRWGRLLFMLFFGKNTFALYKDFYKAH